jgi:hypothetical protein
MSFWARAEGRGTLIDLIRRCTHHLCMCKEASRHGFWFAWNLYIQVVVLLSRSLLPGWDRAELNLWKYVDCFNTV